MPATLYLVSSTAAALTHLLDRLQLARGNRPLAPACLLLPGADTIFTVRTRLGSSLAVQLLEFYALARTILEEGAGWLPLVSDVAARRLLHRLLDEMQARGELSTFSPIREKPGFLQLLLEWIREMKSQGISPDALEAIATSEQERQLATLYRRYQSFLHEAGRSDPDGLLWLAAERLEAQPDLLERAGPLFLLGFDQFSPIQLRILQLLAARVAELHLYLPWDEKRPPSSLALTRLQQTRAQLVARLAPKIERVEEHLPPAPVLAHLRHTLFEPDRPPIRDAEPPALRAIAAPSREAEVREALRAIKQHLLAGVPAEQIALLAPEPANYQRIVEVVAEEYGIPVARTQPLGLNPAIAALINLLQLAPDFPWRQSFDLLRSPYFRQSWLDEEQIDWLDQLTRERPVVAGREQWRQALQPVEHFPAEEDDELGDPPLAARLSPELLARLRQGLMALFDHLLPPARASYREYTAWLAEKVLGLFPEGEEAPPGKDSLHLLACCGEGPFAERDMEALTLLLQALRTLGEAVELIPPPGDGRILWASYRTELITLLQGISPPTEPVTGQIRFAPLEAGRATVVEHLFILGLSEGEFPRPPEPDLFYSPSERLRSPLPLRTIDPAESASLWWQVVSNSRASLTLLRPRLDENGAPWLPSPYWEAVVSQVEGLGERVECPPIAAIPTTSEAASERELLLSLAAGGARKVPASLQKGWRHVKRAWQMMNQREGTSPPGVYEGMILAPDLRAELASQYGSSHGWSASRLNRYGSCPYGFFASVVLALEPRPDPQEGLDPRQRGRLLHALLEGLHRKLAASNLSLDPGNEMALLACLDDCCAELFPTAPQRYGFRPGPLWRHEQAELRRLLRALVRQECEDAKGASFYPFQQELRFGLRGSTLPRLRVVDEQGEYFELHGVIDRIDRDSQGRLRVVDYKSGSTTSSGQDIAKGLAFQTALYALAVEQHFPEGAVVESYYLHIPNRKRGGSIPFASPVAENEVVRAAIEQAIHFVSRIRAGTFPSAPGKQPPGSSGCAERCDFAALCRVSRRSVAKAAGAADSNS